MVIRGISDLIDGKGEVDAQGYQEIAARHASAFAFQVLAKFVPEQTDNSEESSATVSRPKTGIFQAPPLPTYYVERPQISQKLKQHLLGEATAKTGTLVISAIYGLGGIGKSTVVGALAHNPEIQSHFPDGIFWATLGQQPDILSFLSTWIQALGDYDFKPINSDSRFFTTENLIS